MKAKLCLLGFWLAYHTSQAEDSTGVQFSTGSWQNVVARARQEHKAIFIDFGTSWCAPCKKLTQEAMGRKDVGRLFNDHFVNYKLDAEKGEGVRLAKQFNVSAYPTLLFVQPNQEVIYRTQGYEGVAWLIQEVQKVITVSNGLRALPKAARAVEGTFKDTAYLAVYLRLLAQLRQPAGQLLERYLAQLPADEIASAKNLEIIAGTLATTNSRAFRLLLDQISIIRDSSAGQQALITVPTIIDSDFERVVQANDEAGLEQILAYHRQWIQRVGQLNAGRIELDLLKRRMTFYRRTRRYVRYHQLTSAYAQTQLLSQSADSLRNQDVTGFSRYERLVVASDSLRQTASFKEMTESMRHRASSAVADQLNELAWVYYESMPEPNYLRSAVTWIDRSIELSPYPIYLSTRAHLLYKLQQRDQAILQQRQGKRTESGLF